MNLKIQKKKSRLRLIFCCCSEMSSNLLYDSNDERDSFDLEHRQIEVFQRNFLSASVESSEDDDEGIIDGTKIPSSTKQKSRARHAFLDISTLSSTSSHEEIEENPFEIISKSIDIEPFKATKKKKSLGVPKSRILLDTTDIYDQESPTKTNGNSKSSNSVKLLLLLDDDHSSSNKKVK